MSYTNTVYGLVPTQTWEVYRAMALREEGEELHRYVRLTERKPAAIEALTDITPGAFQ